MVIFLSIKRTIEEANIAALEKIIKNTEKEINRVLLEKPPKSAYGQQWLQQRLASCQQILANAKGEMNNWLEEQLEPAFKNGYDEAIAPLKKNQYKTPDATWSSANERAILALAEQMNLQFGDTTFDIFSRINSVVRSTQADISGVGVAAGWSAEETAKAFINHAIEKGLISEDGLQLKFGKWRGDAKSYAKMYARTSMANAFRSGQLKVAADLETDLMQVIGSTGCKLCRPFVGEVLSISGKSKGHKSLNDAKAGGLFHPNCVHHLGIWIKGLSSKDYIEPDSPASKLPLN